MVIGFILGFILLVVLVLLCVFGGIQFSRANEYESRSSGYRTSEEDKHHFTSLKNKSRKIGTILYMVSILVLISFILLPFSFHTVDAGEVAVVKHLGEATGVRDAGTYFDFWITESYKKYDAKVQNLDITAAAYSKDAQTMDIQMTVQYQIDTSKAIEIENQYGSLGVLENRIQSVSVEKAKSVLSSYSAMDIIEQRATISPVVEEIIREAINDSYHVKIVAVVLTNIDFSDAFEATVENKMIAEQEKLKAQYEKETAIVNAEKELEVSKLQAQARLEQAKAEAQAIIQQAQAEASATQLKSIEVARALGFKINEAIITDEEGNAKVEYSIDFDGKTVEEIQLITNYLKHIEYLAKWDGTLPSVVNGESTAVVMPGA